MSRNITVLMVVSAAFGLSVGVYELALPLYLKSRGFAPVAGSVIFAVSVLPILLLRFVTGRLSDIHGRKGFYTASLAACGAANLLTPFCPHLLLQSLLRSLQQAAAQVRATIHSVILYDNTPRRFLNWIGKTSGAEYLFQAAGALVVGYTLGGWEGRAGGGYLRVLLLAGVTLLAACAAFHWGLREHRSADQARAAAAEGASDLFRLGRRQYLLSLIMFIFNIGVGTSHGYVMPLFFQDKFGAKPTQLGWIMALHRLVYVLPLFVAGQVLRGRVMRRQHLVMVVSFILEGLSLAGGGMLGNLYWATGVWLLHDVFGAGVWMPVQSTMMQRYCRSQTRGSDVAVAAGITSLGAALGSLLGGALYTVQAGNLARGWLGLPLAGAPWHGLQFIVGGLLMAAPTPLFLWLHRWDKQAGDMEALAG